MWPILGADALCWLLHRTAVLEVSQGMRQQPRMDTSAIRGHMPHPSLPAVDARQPSWLQEDNSHRVTKNTCFVQTQKKK